MKISNKFKTLLLLTLIFIVPFIGAWYLYFHTNHSMFGKSNHGELIAQPFKLSALHLTSYSGKDIEQRKDDGWRIMFWTSECDVKCLKVLGKLLRVRVALGREQARTQTWLVTNHRLDKIEQGKIADVNGLDTKTYLMANESKSRHLLFDSKKRLLLIDPRGNVIMRYHASVPPKSIHSDLKRLLKVSTIG